MCTLFEVSRVGENQYRFRSSRENNTIVHVYIANKKSKIDNKEICVTRGNDFILTITDLKSRAYFLLQHDGLAYIIGERTLQVDGMNNFRDMGGYETFDGKHVKWGLLYRSDHIYNAKPNGIAFLKTLDIHTIIDYRSQDEIKKYPNPMVTGEETTYNFDPNAHAAELSAQFTSSKDDEDINLVNKIIEQKREGKLINRYDIVMKQYQNFVTKQECKTAFTNMIKILSLPTTPASVQHCRGGKDRTGFGSMLLLGILGVKKKFLIYDYMLTHYNRIQRNNQKMEGYKRITQDQDVLNYLYSLIETKPEFIEASYDAIIEAYTSIENYSIKELGIHKEEIDSLKKLYLE